VHKRAVITPQNELGQGGQGNKAEELSANIWPKCVKFHAMAKTIQVCVEVMTTWPLYISLKIKSLQLHIFFNEILRFSLILVLLD